MSEKDFKNVPAELKELLQWVGWRYEQRDGKPKPAKVPYNPMTGQRASTTDSSTWGTYEQAIEALINGHGNKHYAGIGFVFTAEDPYVGIDLDKCRDPKTGVIEPWATGLIRFMNSYTEVSPSGTGVHIIVKGKLPEGQRRRGNVEVYDRARFFTMTGDQLEDGNDS